MPSNMTYITTDKAAQPMGHYSQAIVHNDTVYVAAQLGIVPGQFPIQVGTLKEQIDQAFKNVKEILTTANSDLDKVLKITIYLNDISMWEEANKACEFWFGEHKPARAMIPVKEMHLGFNVFIDVIAAVNK